MTFKIEEREVDAQTRIIAPAGELDLYRAPELKRAVEAAIDAGATKLGIDLSAVTFIDSTALGVLVGAVKRLRDVEGVVAVGCGDPNILKVFEITGLDRVFAIRATVDEALAAAGDGAGS